MIIKSIGWGLIKTFKQGTLIFLFWSVNLIISLIFLFPYLSAFNHFFSERIVSRLLEQANVYTYYTEFFHFFARPLQIARGNLLLGRLLILIISVILSAGVISTFLRDDQLNSKKFGADSRHFLGRMLRLGIFQLFIVIFFLMVSIVLYLPVIYFLPSLFVENIYFYFLIGWAGLAYLFVLFAFLVFDLSRIQLVKQDSPSILKTIWMAVLSLWRNPVQIYLLYFLLSLIWAAVILVYWTLQSYLSNNSFTGILLELVILQFFVWIQYWIRLSRFSALINISGIGENQEMAGNIG